MQKLQIGFQHLDSQSKRNGAVSMYRLQHDSMEQRRAEHQCASWAFENPKRVEGTIRESAFRDECFYRDGRFPRFRLQGLVNRFSHLAS